MRSSLAVAALVLSAALPAPAIAQALIQSVRIVGDADPCEPDLSFENTALGSRNASCGEGATASYSATSVASEIPGEVRQILFSINCRALPSNRARSSGSIRFRCADFVRIQAFADTSIQSNISGCPPEDATSAIATAALVRVGAVDGAPIQPILIVGLSRSGVESDERLPFDGLLFPGEYSIDLSADAVTGECDLSPGALITDCAVSVSFLDVVSWNNPSGGDYANVANWVPVLRVPTFDGSGGDTAVFRPVRGVSSYTVNAVGATARRFIVDGAALRLVGSAEVFDGSIATPSLAIRNSGSLALDSGSRLRGVSASVGDSESGADSLSSMEMAGAGTDLTLSGRIVVGEFAPGELSMADGARLACGPAFVGDLASGQASLIGGGTTWDADSLIIGATTGAGEVVVRELAELNLIATLTVGDRAEGTLRLLAAGKTTAREVVIGAEPGTGRIEVQNDASVEGDSFLDVTGTLRFGHSAGGRLSISDGAAAELGALAFSGGEAPDNPEALSLVFVTGRSAAGEPSELIVNSATSLATGDLNIEDGARATFTDLNLGQGGETAVAVGDDASGPDPPFANLFARRVAVGVDSAALLNLRNTGSLGCEQLVVGDVDLGGVGRVRFGERISSVSGLIRVSGDDAQVFGATGDANVVVTGGTLIAGGLILGDEASPHSAELVVRDGDEAENIRASVSIANGESGLDCAIGDAGPGRLRLENFASFFASGRARVGNSALGGEGLVEVGADCEFESQANIDVGGASPGTVRLLTESSVVRVGGQVNVRRAGSVEGVGTVEGPVFIDVGGFMTPGLSPGTLTINGDYAQVEGGTLVIEAGGLEAGQFDVLRVNGRAKLGGTLEMRFVGGYLPRTGDAIEFVQAAATDGRFAIIAFPTVAPGFDARVVIAADGRITMTALVDAQPLDDDAPAPPACGAGACSAAGLGLISASLLGALSRRRVRRRRRA